MIKIYGKEGCPQCVSACHLLESRGIKYDYYSLGEDYTKEEFMLKFNGARTLPQVTLDDVHLGGYQELSARISMLEHLAEKTTTEKQTLFG